MEFPDLLDAPSPKKKPPRPVGAAVALMLLGLSGYVLIRGYSIQFDESLHDQIKGPNYRFLAWPLGILYATVFTFLALVFIFFAKIRKELLQYSRLAVLVVTGILFALIMGTLFYALPELGIPLFS